MHMSMCVQMHVLSSAGKNFTKRTLSIKHGYQLVAFCIILHLTSYTESSTGESLQLLAVPKSDNREQVSCHLLH